MKQYSDSLFRCHIPDRWQAFAGSDAGKVHIYKDIDSPEQVYLRAGITICIHPNKSWYYSTRNFYDDVADIAPLEIGGRVWQGYTCTSLGYPYTMLEAEDGPAMLQVMVLERNGDYVISLEDTDVLAILASIERY